MNRFALCLLSALIAANLSAAERTAFVIGIKDYPDAPLDNAVRDAEAVRGMLTTKLGFPAADVVFAENPSRLDLFEKFAEFKGKAAGAKIVLLYYAGMRATAWKASTGGKISSSLSMPRCCAPPLPRRP